MRRHPHLLEVSAWPWLTRLSRDHHRHVTLGDVPDAEWDRLASGGFDVLYLMGVWQRSALGRMMAQTDQSLLTDYDRVLPGWVWVDVPGSPYCIQAYEPDGRMGEWAGLDAARRELHARGMRLIVDFVPNHTGFDHPWVANHPERYVLGTLDDYRKAPSDFRPIDVAGDLLFVACGRDPYFPPWRDVAQLNYFNPDTRDAVRATLGDIAQHCDGVRCDMAMLMLNDVFERTWRSLLRERWPSPAEEFWPATTRALPDLTYVAEVYWNLEGVLLDQGFSFAYDKRLLDCLHAPFLEIASRVSAFLSSGTPDSGRLARFLENHDEPRSAAVLGALAPAAAVLVATLPGMRFFFDGQADGWRIRAPVQLGRWPDERQDDAIRALYDRLLHTASETVFHQGDWRLLHSSEAGDDSFRDLVAYRWAGGGDLAVVVANLGQRVAQGSIRLDGDVPDGAACDFEDRLTDARYRWTREALLASGLYVRLDPGRAHVFKVHTLR